MRTQLLRLKLPQRNGTVAGPGRTQAQNHPRPGSSTKVGPIRDLKAIKRIKYQLRDAPRDLCLFTLGINTAYRAGELLSLTVGQVDHLRPGDRLDVKQSKSGKYRPTTLNQTVIYAVENWLKVHPDPQANAPLFWSPRTRKPLVVAAVNRLVKKWCADVGLKGNYGSHTLRKTWAYHQRVTFGKPTALLTCALGHASEWQTFEYICVQPEEIKELYASEL